jgi:hypothetical protein
VHIGDEQGAATFFRAAPGDGKTDARTCGGSDKNRLAAQEAMRRNVLWTWFHGEVE